MRGPYNRRVEPSTRFGDMTVAAFVESLGSAAPVPGGGSAAAVAASLAAALVSMVASLSQDRPKYAAHAALHAESITAARDLAAEFLTLADEDAEAYGRYVAAMKLPRDTDAQREERAAALRAAAGGASQAPFQTVQACAKVVSYAEALAGRSNRNASSDLEVAALLSVAASRAAAANVYVNLPAIEDEAVSRDLYLRTDALVDEVSRLADLTREAVRGGEAREPLETGNA
jgi:formiminotetrahydrofolate cyclodeaminase